VLHQCKIKYECLVNFKLLRLRDPAALTYVRRRSIFVLRRGSSTH
jgi:hypothetical protein